MKSDPMALRATRRVTLRYVSGKGVAKKGISFLLLNNQHKRRGHRLSSQYRKFNLP